MPKDATPTELAACALCCSDDSTLLYAEPTLSPGLDRGIVRCLDCGLVYRDIRPAQSVLMQRYVQQSVSQPSVDWIEGRKQVYRPYLAALEPYRQGSRILDIGAGHGFFLAACRERDWSCIGVEPSVECREYARRELGVELRTSLDDLDPGSEPFDAVTFWNVLDQLADPATAVSKAHSLLRPGGAIVIRSPNAAFHTRSRDWIRRLAGVAPRLRSWDPSVFHLWSFDRRTLTRLLSEGGFPTPRISCAQLTWTTSHTASSGTGQRLMTLLIEATSRAIFTLSNRSLLLSPSLLAVATRPTEHGTG